MIWLRLCIVLFGTNLVLADYDDEDVQDRLMIPSHLNHLSDEYIDSINSLNTTWKAGRNFHPDVPESFYPSLVGANLDDDIHDLATVIGELSDLQIPEEFDSRKNWPQCPTIRKILDQASCGSCWAFGATTALSDRFCIASNGNVIVELSPQDLLTCCHSCGRGCHGGSPAKAWKYFVKHGVVTGGPYGDKTTCQPFFMEPCLHNVTGNRPPCPKGFADTPKCEHQCQPSYNRPYFDDKYYAQSAYRILHQEKQIQMEIMFHGPVETGFKVYWDFVHYKSGIYQRHSEKLLGGHAVRLIGWGSENGVPYWLVANSWNTDWGENGYFRILRGKHECGFAKRVVAGKPFLG